MPITSLPNPPTRSDPLNFNSRADAFLSALPAFVTEANTLQSDVNAKQAAAATSATNALASENAAAANSGATIWVSGTTYAIGNVRFSPITYLSYRRKTAGAGTTDPSSDNTNWQLINGTGNVDLTSTQTLTNKTFSTGSVWNGIAVPIANGGTSATTAVNAFTAIKQAASETDSGVVELATASEVASGIDTNRVVTPYTLKNSKHSDIVSIGSFSSYGITGIPNWVTRITLIITNMSTSAVSNIYILIGGATSGYMGNVSAVYTSTAATSTSTSSAVIVTSAANNVASDVFTGKVVLERGIGSNVWTVTGVITETTALTTLVSQFVVDHISAVSLFSINTSAGTFDGGNIRYSWE